MFRGRFGGLATTFDKGQDGSLAVVISGRRVGGCRRSKQGEIHPQAGELGVVEVRHGTCAPL